MIVRDANVPDAPLTSVEPSRKSFVKAAVGKDKLPPLGVYRHFKGGLYIVFGYGLQVDDLVGWRNTETQVLYTSLETGEWFCRSALKWNELVEGKGARFVPVWVAPE